MREISLAILSLLFIYLIDKYKNTIAKKTKLLDYPDKIRKLHKRTTPLLGGIMVFLSFVLINLYLIFFQDLDKTSLITFVCCAFFLLIGLVDDIKIINYKYKFLILFTISYLMMYLDPNLQINKIYFATFDKEFYLNYLSIPFTVLCLLILVNAINLMDGMDGLCILVSIVLMIWLINTFQSTESLYVVIIISLIYILYLNLKKNIFLGDSGSLFLGCLIALNIISNYNLETSRIHYPIENIFIALMLPGFDMLRVFLMRIINKKNPFLPDRIHLHHLLIDRGLNKSNILTIFLLLIVLPILINIFTSFKSVYIILFYTIFYIFLILKLKNLSKKNY